MTRGFCRIHNVEGAPRTSLWKQQGKLYLVNYFPRTFSTDSLVLTEDQPQPRICQYNLQGATQAPRELDMRRTGAKSPSLHPHKTLLLTRAEITTSHGAGTHFAIECSPEGFWGRWRLTPSVYVPSLWRLYRIKSNFSMEAGAGGKRACPPTLCCARL